jgi:hypothetical protein
MYDHEQKSEVRATRWTKEGCGSLPNICRERTDPYGAEWGGVSEQAPARYGVYFYFSQSFDFERSFSLT